MQSALANVGDRGPGEPPNPVLSTLEALSIGAGGYLVATELLGGSTLEGLMVGAPRSWCCRADLR